MRTLLFDIDGTLLLTNRGGGRALELAIEQEFAVADACMNINFSGRTDRSLLVEILQQNGLPTDDNYQCRLRDVYTGLLPAVLNERGGRILPGVVELLERISSQSDLLCCVMTGNLLETAKHKLNHFGLSHFFHGIFGGDHDCDRDDLALRTSAALHGRYGETSTDDIIVIGDTPDDIRCGHTIGAKVLAVCTGSHDRKELEADRPMAVVEDLSDVSSVFDLLTRAIPSQASRL